MQREDLDGFIHDVALARSAKLRKTYVSIAWGLLAVVPIGAIFGFANINYCGASYGSPAPCAFGFLTAGIAGAFAIGLFAAAARGAVNSYYLREAGFDTEERLDGGHEPVRRGKSSEDIIDDEDEDYSNRPSRLSRIEQLQEDGSWLLIMKVPDSSDMLGWVAINAMAKRMKSVLRVVSARGSASAPIDGTS